MFTIGLVYLLRLPWLICVQSSAWFLCRLVAVLLLSTVCMHLFVCAKATYFADQMLHRFLVLRKKAVSVSSARQFAFFCHTCVHCNVPVILIGSGCTSLDLVAFHVIV